MFKRTLLVGLFIVLTFVPAAGQDNTPQLLLIATHDFDALETTISALDIDTGSLEALFTVDTYFAEFSLSPTGDKLAYFTMMPARVALSEYLYNPSEVTFYVRDVFGEESKAVATNAYLVGNSSGKSAIAPSWSPDGTHVVVVNQNESTGEPQFTFIDATTDAVTHVTPAQPSPFLYPPLWSSDGTTLAYFAEWCSRCGLGNVYTTSTSAVESPHPVFADTGYPHYELLIGWLPNSRELVVIRNDEGYRYTTGRLMSVNVDTGEKFEMPEYEASPFRIWQFLDDTVALVTNRDERDNTVLRAIDLLTGEERFSNVIEDATEPLVVSPDNTHVVIPVHLNDQESSLHIFDLITGGLVTSIPTEFLPYRITWTPDGSYLVFSENSQIFTVAVDGSEEVRAVVEIDGDFLGWAHTNRQAIEDTVNMRYNSLTLWTSAQS